MTVKDKLLGASGWHPFLWLALRKEATEIDLTMVYDSPTKHPEVRNWLT